MGWKVAEERRFYDNVRKEGRRYGAAEGYEAADKSLHGLCWR